MKSTSPPCCRGTTPLLSSDDNTPLCGHPTIFFYNLEKNFSKKKRSTKSQSFLFLKTGEYNGDPKNNLAESEGRKTGKIDQKHWKQPKWALEGPKKALWGLFRPFKALFRPFKAQ